MDIEDLEVYQLAEDLAVHIYEGTKRWPEDEKYGLISQASWCVCSLKYS